MSPGKHLQLGPAVYRIGVQGSPVGQFQRLLATPKRQTPTQTHTRCPSHVPTKFGMLYSSLASAVTKDAGGRWEASLLSLACLQPHPLLTTHLELPWGERPILPGFQVPAW